MDIISKLTQFIPHVSKAYAESIDTAIGPLPTDMPSLVSIILKYATYIGGMIAVLMLASGGFGLMTSSGDPEKLMNAKETINNALMGLALIVLSVFIMELIGVNILGIAFLKQNL